MDSVLPRRNFRRGWSVSNQSMSNTVDLLAILLSGIFPPRRREKSELREVTPSNDVLLDPGNPPERTLERPTLRLLRLVGRYRAPMRLS